MKHLSLLLFIFIAQTMSAQFKSKLIKIDSCKYQLMVTQLSDSSQLIKRLPYPVFKLRQMDVNEDGSDEIILGVEKITIHDSIVRKRINIYKIQDNKIAPLWLGSFLPQPLYDFEVVREKDSTIFKTIELEKSGLYLVATYQWHSFGIKFIQYIKREITLDEAFTIINQHDEKN